jgi:hypothetical protein
VQPSKFRFRIVGAAKAGRMVRKRPCRGSGRRNRDARRQADLREPSADVANQPTLSAEQMRHPRDVEPQSVSIDLDEGRPTAGPARELPHQRGIAIGIALNGDQCRIERASIGQAGPCPRAAFRRGFRDSMDDRPMRSFDGKDDRRVRRAIARLRPALDGQVL